jgi:glycosyltransferase involved in cell wall biosynthesis
MHRISFIIPVFNAGPLLHEALASIRNNQCPDTEFEIVVVDDASTDRETLAILHAIETDEAQVKVLRNRHNLGPARTRNRGVAASSGEWIAFLDADDIIPPGTMQRRLDILHQRPDTNWFAGNFALLGQQDEPASFFPDIGIHAAQTFPWGHVLPRPTRFCIESSLCFQVGTTMSRRALWLASGGFDDDLRYGEDWLLWLGMSRLADVAWIREPCLLLRRGHASMMSNRAAYALNVARSRRKAYRSALFRPYRRQLRWRLAGDYRLASALWLDEGRLSRSLLALLNAVLLTPNDGRNLVQLGRITRTLLSG